MFSHLAVCIYMSILQGKMPINMMLNKEKKGNNDIVLKKLLLYSVKNLNRSC